MTEIRGVYQPTGLYISVRQAANLLGKRQQDIYYYINHCDLRAYKIDTQWILDKDDVLNFKIPKPGPRMTNKRKRRIKHQ